jgi:hypothetical protein
VEWWDARTEYEDKSFEEAEVECHCRRRFTLGYLVKQTTRKIVLAHTFDPPEKPGDGDAGGDFTTIPASWVRGIRRLS